MNLNVYDKYQGKFIGWSELNEIVKSNEYFGDSRIKFEDIAMAPGGSLYILTASGNWEYAPNRFELLNIDEIQISEVFKSDSEFERFQLTTYIIPVDVEEDKKRLLCDWINEMAVRLRSPEDIKLLESNPAYYGTFIYEGEGTRFKVDNPSQFFDLVADRWEFMNRVERSESGAD